MGVKDSLRNATGFCLLAFALMGHSGFSAIFRNRACSFSCKTGTQSMVLSAYLLVSHCFGFQFN
jgi:hypothetical protein